MNTFNHSSQSITLRYIGVNQDQKDELYSFAQFLQKIIAKSLRILYTNGIFM